jgi:hypothetical protein
MPNHSGFDKKNTRFFYIFVCIQAVGSDYSDSKNKKTCGAPGTSGKPCDKKKTK